MNTLNIADIIAGRYQIVKMLGHGGTGITYAAKDLQLEKTVALKVLSLHRINDWKVLELFEREAKILANLDHPSIPQYIDYFQIDTEQEKAFYIVQQLAPGKSLFDWINQGWRPTIKEVFIIAAQVLKILVYLQQLTPAVIHRDIKPQNIIRSSDGKIFVVDFGAVQDTYHNTVTGGSTIVGTFGYMAPEQFRGQAVLSTDLYGLGTTLLFLLTGQSPVDLPQHQLKINFKSAIQLQKYYADWLERMIEPVSSTRFTSAQQALDALLKKSLPPRPLVAKRPKDTAIRLTQTNNKFNQLIIDIPNTLLNSPLSFWLGMAPLFASVFSLVILYNLFFEVIEPFLNPQQELEVYFRLLMVLFSFRFATSIWMLAAKSLLFSSTFYARFEIMSWHEIQVVKTLLNFWNVKSEITCQSMSEVKLEQYKFLFWKFPSYYCVLKTDSKKVKFGLFLSLDEKVWVVEEIRKFIGISKNNQH